MLNNALPGARDQPLLRFDQPVPHDSLLLIHLPSGKFEHAAAIQSLDLPSSQALGLSPLRPPNRQRGGRQAAQAYLTSFLQTRSAFYRGGISSPLRAPEACSRLSVYLSFGCISLREVVQQSRCRLETIGDRSDRQYKGLEGFLSRLHWHCHFIQKLETEPAIECSNMHRGYDGLRESEFDQARFEALKAAQTGWPMVDACVRMLEDCGWLNFRMRAMLVSVASYPLWLHWREVGLWLARHFLDFEAGIHWSQMQMQSGTTGINTTRVYNPIKQAIEHDPQGIFVRRWLPALRSLPDQYIFEPWLAPLSLRDSRTDPIVEPIVDLARATREAKAKLYALRAKAAVIAESKSVVRKHASAMRSQERYLPSSKRQVDGGQGQGRKAPETATLATQMSFDFEETGKVQR
jgi:deoxyribodipyrimidine photo-lyase